MRKATLTLALLLAGCATALAQDMRRPINADEVKWGLPHRIFQQEPKSPSLLVTHHRTDLMLFG
jgi:hypothetical protein